MSNTGRAILFILIGMGITVSLIISAVFIIFIIFSTPQVTVKNNSWLLLDFAGTIREKPSSQVSIAAMAGRELGLLHIIGSINQAQYDDRITGILINGDLTFYSKAHMDEINGALVDFKESGKQIIAWFSNGINRNYFMCLEADEIYMPPTNSAGLMLRGYAASIPYFKQGMDKLGIEFTVIHIGEYKGSGENYTRSSMSDELRKNHTGIYDSIYEQTINTIVKRRNIDKDNLEKLLRSGDALFMTPDDAQAAGLIDGQYTLKALQDYLAQSEKFESISIAAYSTQFSASTNRRKIALVHIDGAISNYYNSEDGMWGTMTGAKSFNKDIEAIAEDKQIDAVIIRINSPGGSALGSELMLQALIKLKETKPVYVSMGSMAASGGYYISLAGEKIFASPYTITGSIGVVSMLMNYKGLTDKIGVSYETVKKYEHDDAFSPVRKPSELEKRKLAQSMRGIYKEFTQHVVTQRNIDEKVIPILAEGRVWTGVQAVENGLVDQLGGLVDTLEYVRETHDLKENSIISYPKPPGFLESILSQAGVQVVVSPVLELIPQQIRLLVYFCRENGYQPACILPYYSDF